MSSSPLSSQEIRAAAEAHRELGAEYHDAVVESFLAKIEKEIDARVEARLADPPPTRSRQLEPITLAKRRLALKYMTLGSAAAAIPLSITIFRAEPFGPTGPKLLPIVLWWILFAAVYGAAAFLLRPSRRDRE
jgi:hypothetical protein